MKIGLYTLGCKLNFSESSTFVRELIVKGHDIVDFSEYADIYVVHSCAVTQTAEKKTRATIRQAHRTNPLAKIIVIGCYAQLKADEISKIDGVAAVLGNEAKFDIVRLIEAIKTGGDEGRMTAIDECGNNEQITRNMEPMVVHHPSFFVPKFHGAWSGGDRTRSFVKIQDGCDYYCTYCTVSYARGESRSGTIVETMKSIRDVASNGFKELVITGVNLGDFGRKNGETFYDLLKEIETVEEIKRVRISSIEPNLLTDEIIELVSKSEKLLPHFHIPLQSGSDVMLGLMKRRYKTELFAKKVLYIKQLMPNACIAADVIVGFNGETNEEFETTYNFINSLPISYLHVFTYSERPGTKGLDIAGKVQNSVRDERSKVLHKLSDAKQQIFYSENKGLMTKVLWEDNNHNGMMSGWTENYIEVKKPYNKESINTIENIKL